MAMQGKRDMTQGVIWKELLLFFFPLMAGTLFQMLYNVADTLIVGRYVGTSALSAVGGAAAALINIFIGLFVGISSGSSVVAAQAFGAGKKEEVNRTVHTSVVIAVVFGIVLTALCVFCARPLLVLMRTPSDSLADSIVYLRTYGLGMIANMIYNMGAGVFRALGDSRRPFLYLVAGTITNVALDILFIRFFGMGVFGAAFATILSQILSAVLVVIAFARGEEMYRLHLRKLRVDGAILKRIIRIGVPSAVQSMMYSVSNALIQTFVNDFGTVTVAAWAVTGKIDSLFWMITNSLGISTTTFTGQNYGAGNMTRVRKGIRDALILMTVFAAAFGVALYFLSPTLVSFFTEDMAVLAVGIRLERFFARAYLTYVCIEILSGALRGMGDAVVPTVIIIIGVCALRILWLFIVVPFSPNVITVSWSYPVTWIVTSAAFVIYTIARFRKFRV